MEMAEEKPDYRDPNTEITDTPEGAKLVVELPGARQDSIKMAVSKDVIEIKAEGSRGKFETIQVMPYEPDPDRISVSFSQGVLEVLLPTKSEDKKTEDKKELVGEDIKRERGPPDPFNDEMGRLNEELIRVTEEKASLEERVSFLQRDFQNLQRRHEAEKDRMVDRKIHDLALDVVEVYDNFKRAEDSVENTNVSKKTKQNILSGLRIVQNQVERLFARINITHIRAMGECFDPRYHEAVGKIEDPSLEDEVIVEEHRPGYMFKDEVLRPAQVVINRVPKGASGKKCSSGGRKKTA
jgi:molecular chaperone GrpE